MVPFVIRQCGSTRQESTVLGVLVFYLRLQWKGSVEAVWERRRVRPRTRWLCQSINAQLKMPVNFGVFRALPSA